MLGLFKQGLFKGAGHLAYKSAYGLSAKELLAHKLRTIITEFERHRRVTDCFLDQLNGEGKSVVTDDIITVAQAAGYAAVPTGLIGVFATVAKDAWDEQRGSLSPMKRFLGYDGDRIVNEQYYREEEGKSLAEEEFELFVELARIALKEVETGEKDLAAADAIEKRASKWTRNAQATSISKSVSERYERIEKAIEKGEISIVRDAIRQGVDDSVQLSRERDPLIMCAAIAKANALELTRMLLDAGANVNARNENGESALFRATGDVMDLLLERGAKSNARSKYRETPLLHHAAMLKIASSHSQRDDTRVLLRDIRTLIHHGADVNAIKGKEETILHVFIDMCCEGWDTDEAADALRELLQLLMAHGFKLLNHRNQYGHTTTALANKKNTAVLKSFGGV